MKTDKQLLTQTVWQKRSWANKIWTKQKSGKVKVRHLTEAAQKNEPDQTRFDRVIATISGNSKLHYAMLPYAMRHYKLKLIPSLSATRLWNIADVGLGLGNNYICSD